MEQFVNRGSKRTQHQWSEASKYHPDYLLKSNLAHHFVQRFWPSKGFTFLFGLYKWACPNVPCIWGSQKIKRAMLHVGRRGPIFCQIIFYCGFWSTRKLLYFPLPVLLCLFICSSQTWHLNFSIFRGKNTRFYPWYFFKSRSAFQAQVWQLSKWDEWFFLLMNIRESALS